MSTISMTGFGRGSASSDGVTVSVEISSVNRKQLDCAISLPKQIATLEAEVLGLIRKAVFRGQVRMTVVIDKSSFSSSMVIDRDLVASEISALKKLAADLGLPGGFSAESLLRLPDALAFTCTLSTDTCLPVLREAVGEALKQLNEMRSREGAALAKDVSARFSRLREIRGRLAERAKVSPGEYKQKLAARLEKLSSGVAVEPEILARELIVFADRTDVSEELTRIASHIDQAEAIMAGTEPSGRSLDFLCQELLREINTTGSKASDAEMAQMVVEFKSLLETIREQVQNFE